MKRRLFRERGGFVLGSILGIYFGKGGGFVLGSILGIYFGKGGVVLGSILGIYFGKGSFVAFYFGSACSIKPELPFTLPIVKPIAGRPRFLHAGGDLSGRVGRERQHRL
jgi:hypothetical protein